MSFKDLSRKTKIGIKIFRSDGFLGFLVLCVRFIEKTLLKFTHSKSVKHQISVHVKYRDALAADFRERKHLWGGSSADNLTFNWLMPPPGRGSGGHLNIFRFINYLEAAGHTCRIYLYTQHSPGRVSDVRALMGDSYPKLNATMEWIDSGNEMEAADGIFATSWETAYASFNASTTGKRFYFVQDFEPYFYPTGTLSVLAENTYKFGFYGVTAGNWLATKLRSDYGMQTDHFDFGADKQLYTHQNFSSRNEIFFYARPYTERRGFEMGIMALDLFHKQHPKVVINLAGWDVSDYDIPFPYNNLQTLELKDLNKLYNKCAAALVLSLTNMSLLPLELLSSGVIPIVNEGENNLLVSNNPYIQYTATNPVALAEALSAIVSRKDLPAFAKKASDSIAATSWNDSGTKFVKIVEREVRRHE
jgi:glycosyltransferase involved in cell wall biosynthesis